VPGPPVGLLAALEHLDQGPMGGSPAKHRGLLVDGRADQRMPKHQLGVDDRDQPGLLGRLQRRHVHIQDPAGGQDGGQLTGVLGRRD
jgi:hypothetical protein